MSSTSPFNLIPNKENEQATPPLSSSLQNSNVSNINWESASRPDLIRYIQILTDQSNKYERRFKDVVKAYKSLQNERDALESGLKATLLSKQPSQDTITVETNQIQDTDDITQVPCINSKSGEKQPNLQEQIFILTKAVSTLTEEKAKLQSDYQEDKKQSLLEYQNERRKLTESYDQAEKDISNLIVEKQSMVEELNILKRDSSLSENKLSEAESKLREQTENINQLEHKLNEVSLRESKEKEEYINKQSELINPLREKLQQTEEELKIVKGRLSEADKVISGYDVAIDESERKHSMLEEELASKTRQKDERVENLEEQIRELSITVGAYQVTITEQEQQINDLIQNSKLPILDNAQSTVSKLANDYPIQHVSETIAKLSEQESKLRSILQILLRHFLPNFKLTIDQLCSLSKTELLQHIAAHKINQQTKTDNEKLLEDYKTKYSTLQKNLKKIEEEFLLKNEKTNEEHEIQINELTGELQKKELECKSKLNELENKFFACRDEISEQLADKEAEISRLKRKCLSTTSLIPPIREKQLTESALQELITVNGYHSDTSASFHHTQLKQRQKEKQKVLTHEFEELKNSIIDVEYREIKHLEQISFLQNEILRLDNNSTRLSVNYEYLKNVILQYIIASKQQQLQLLPAVSSVLKLNKVEIDKIKTANNTQI